MSRIATKSEVKSRLQGYSYESLRSLAERLEDKGVTVPEISKEAVAQALVRMDDETARDPDVMREFGRLEINRLRRVAAASS